MKQRTLGQGLTVSAIGMGCMTLTRMNYGPVDEEEAAATLRAAIDRGVTLLDTAETYGDDYANERLIGDVIKTRRADVIISTKFGLSYDRVTGEMELDGRPELIRQSCEGSLRRLQTDYIDLYFQHRVDPRVPVEEVWGELSLLVDEGKVRHLGLSEPSIDNLNKAHAIHPVSALENEYSLFTRDPEDQFLPLAKELGIGLICFAPLGRGLLSGKVRSPDDWAPDDFRRRLPRYQGENFYKNLALVDRVHDLARERGMTPAQFALAWLLSRGDNIVPIPGMEVREYMDENIAAADMELDEDALRAIDELVPDGAFGDRYGDYKKLSDDASKVAPPTGLGNGIVEH